MGILLEVASGSFLHLYLSSTPVILPVFFQRGCYSYLLLFMIPSMDRGTTLLKSQPLHWHLFLCSVLKSLPLNWKSRSPSYPCRRSVTISDVGVMRSSVGKGRVWIRRIKFLLKI